MNTQHHERSKEPNGDYRYSTQYQRTQEKRETRAREIQRKLKRAA